MTVYREHRLRASKAKINLTRLDSEGVDSAKDRSCLYNSKEVTWVVWYVRKSKNNDRKKYLPSWEERSSTSAFNIALRFASKRLTVVKQKRINTVRKSESHMVFFAYHECDIDTFILGCNIGCFLHKNDSVAEYIRKNLSKMGWQKHGPHLSRISTRRTWFPFELCVETFLQIWSAFESSCDMFEEWSWTHRRGQYHKFNLEPQVFWYQTRGTLWLILSTSMDSTGILEVALTQYSCHVSSISDITERKMVFLKAVDSGYFLASHN